MKELILSYDDTEQLKRVVESAYFTNGMMGKKTQSLDYLTVSKDEMLYTILSSMVYKRVKIKNFKILGTLTCDIIKDDETLILRPVSEICMKEHKKYNFY